MGEVVVTRPRRGEIWWGETVELKGRPYLVLSRDISISARARAVVAPITSRRRGHAGELELGSADGLARNCVANFDEVLTLAVSLLTIRLGALDGVRIHEMCAAMRASIDC